VTYWRPIPMTDPFRPKDAERLAGGWCWFDRIERMTRAGDRDIAAFSEVPTHIMERLIAPRMPIAAMTMDRPRIMGILNVTPDSFSDGGMFNTPDAAVAQARAMVEDGADIIDIGGESTRPGATPVDIAEEKRRTVPVIAAIRAEHRVPISIDTRNAPVAQAALEAGATLVNDVSGFLHDTSMQQTVAQAGAPCCLMHSIKTPETMQDDPFSAYEDVVFDVYDHLAACVTLAERAGIRRDQIMVDPGIGFGKTLEHNLALLKNLSLFHGLGCAVLLGASRKRFIGTLGNVSEAKERMPGSVAVALHGVRQGVQILRVHDTPETRQALSLHMAVN